MSGDRTTPMPQPDWSQRGRSQDDQETMFANSDSPTPPTLPMDSPEPARWQRDPAPAFRPAPPPVAPQVPGIGGGPQFGEPPAGQTVIMSQRPTPVFAWLVLVEGPDRNAIGTVYPLRADTTTVGRVPGNDIALRDPTCSAQHVRIRAEVPKAEEKEKEKKTDFVLYDLGSRNGTFVGDRASYKEDDSRRYRHVLQDGDYLLIGETTLAFKRL